ncbi:MAG: cell envelope integrity protein CreD [Pseudoxanthomonas suwonensis]|nr:cell envelope integrity protein CreD [Pseudoxanthomonas suwonensis]
MPASTTVASAPRWRLPAGTPRLSLLVKAATVGLLCLLLLIPLGMILGLVSERQGYRNLAVEQVAASSAQAQVLAAPVLVVPYVEQVEVEEVDRDGGRRTLWREQSGHWLFFPAHFELDGSLQPESRQLGLHEVRVYTLAAAMQARFDARIPDNPDPTRPRRIGQPQLRWDISDVRGLLGTPVLQVNGQRQTLQQGAGERSGVHAMLPAPVAGERLQWSVRMDLDIAGTESLSVMPLADENRVTLASPWPHPQFNGAFLPGRREVATGGFRADWQVSALASQAQAQYRAGGDAVVDSFGVALVEPVNVYSMSERATKYGFLFVLLTFGGFLLLEVVRRLRIHPIQYGLVGVALALFFLLLLSLSEHIAFAPAYLVAAAACLLLLGFYVGSILHSRVHGLGFAAALALLYAALYGLLVSEDNALVLGAGLLFVVVAAVMVMTRHIDWYRVGGEQD